MQYQVSIASLFNELQESCCWKRHNFCPIVQSKYYHDNTYSERQTNWLCFIQKEIWTGMMVWLTTLERNIQSNEHTARLYIYTRVVLQALHWYKRSLDRRLEADFHILWMKVFEGVLHSITTSKFRLALDQRHSNTFFDCYTGLNFTFGNSVCLVMDDTVSKAKPANSWLWSCIWHLSRWNTGYMLELYHATAACCTGMQNAANATALAERGIEPTR